MNMHSGITLTMPDEEKQHSHGTLFLAILIALAILAGNGYYVYPEHLLVVNREEGRAALQEVISRQDGFRRQHNRYAATLEELGYTNVQDFAIDSPQGLYKVLIVEAESTTYTLAAEPQGEQTGDSKCAALTYASKGHAKSAKGSAGGACW
ncbi:MAG: type IV pilin protein [Magnetococcus sp. DMHC-8]